MLQESDLLASASLVLAGLTIFYDRWYDEFERIGSADDRFHYQEDKHIEVKAAMRRRAAPLCAAVIVAGLIFLPDAIVIVLNAIVTVSECGLVAIRSYSAILAAYVFVECLFAGLVCVSWRSVAQLRRADKRWQSRLKGTA